MNTQQANANCHTDGFKFGGLRHFQSSILPVFLFLLTLLLLAGTAWGTDFTSNGSGYWTNPVTWGGGAGGPVPTNSADNVYIQSGHTITNTGTSQISINSLSITGTLTHAYGTSHAINLKTAGNLTIAAAGKITADNLGSMASGAGNGERNGAGHGGTGGTAQNSSPNTPGSTYGSITNPVTQGSYSRVSYPGGGLVILVISGNLTNNGVISAKGASWASSPGGNYGSGAGGSINLTVDGAMSMPSSASISADGGDGRIADATNDQAGGGGRIAIRLTGVGQTFGSVDLTKVTAYGGLDHATEGGHGGAGTVYLKTQAQSYGDLIVNNDNRPSSSRGGQTLVKDYAYRFNSITLTNSGVCVMGTNSTLDLTGCTLLTPQSTTNSITSRLILGTAGSTVIWPSAWTNNGTISWVGTAGVTTNMDLTIASGGILTHEANTSSRINLNLTGNLTIDSGGAIWVDGRGYDTAGTGRGIRGGAGHGGQGGKPSNSAPNLHSDTYGSITNPVTQGSYSHSTYPGGGVVLLKISGNVTNNGLISARGASNTGVENYGSGSGGSINLTVSGEMMMPSSASIKADGGNGRSVAGDDQAGGGGRIAIYLTGPGQTFANVDLSKVTAYGGADAAVNGGQGGAGTVYLKTQADTYGKLIVNNNNLAQGTLGLTGSTLISPSTQDAFVGDVELRNQAMLVVSNARTLTVYGNWSNGTANAVGGAGNVEFRGATTNTLYGSTVFPGFVCTNAPGKKLLFQANTTNTMLTKLNIAGASGSPVSLLPATAGQQWFIKATNTMSPAPDISYVAVQNSTAVTNAIGQPLIAQFSSTGDLGGNTNWAFPTPQAKVWNGSVSTSWGTPENWTPTNVPQSTDMSITIPVAPGNQPILDTTRIYACPLIIETGARLSLGGNSLTVDANVTNAGTIIAAASETLTFSKDVDFTGGSFTCKTSTLKLNAAAAGSQTFKPGNCTFYRIEVPNAATVTVQNADFTASQFSCRAPGATLNFQDSSTYTITDLDLRGSSSGATTNFVTLRSTNPGTKWNLNVTRAQTVRYVDAQDSDADGGLTIYAVNSVNTGSNNDNWNFGNTKAWAGGTSTDWANANNWSPSGVPGATDYVLIDGYYANAPTISANTTNLGLAVGGYASNAVLTLKATLTVDGNAVVQPTYGKINFSNDTAGALTVNTDLSVFGRIECQRASIGGNGVGRVITVGGKLTVGAGGLIDANGMGFDARGGPGEPGPDARGGAHGGEPNGYNDAPAWPPTYGSITGPSSLGSGGWFVAWGGGAIRLNVGGLTTIESGAIVRADATDVGNSGAGGSVWLTTGTLTGGGTISAKGGDGNGDGQGGGGRIAIVVTNGAYTGTLTVRAYGAYKDGVNDAAAGTVYVKGNNTPATGTLIVDNTGRVSTTASRTRIGALVTEKTVGDVILRNAGYMAVSAGQTLTVNGSWSNAVATNAISGGTVVFAGTTPATVWGGNTWSNLTIATLGKTVNFQAGATQFVYGVPVFSTVTLQSTVPGTWWYLRKPGSGTQDVDVVTVQDSHAGTAGTHYTFRGAKGSTDSGNNVNWRFLKYSGTMFLLR